MVWDTKLNKIEDILAGIYPKIEECDLILDRAELERSRIAVETPTSLIRWHNILTKAIQKNELDKLILVCIAESGSVALIEAYNEYLLGKVKTKFTGLGESLHIMCNRENQEQDFEEHFSRHIYGHSGLPLVYIVYGNHEQCHSSFITRLRETSIPRFVGDSTSQQTVPVKYWKIDIPIENDSFESWKRLRFLLFKNCNPKSAGAGNLTPEKFGKEIESMSFPVIVIEHNIKIEALRKIGKDVIKSYLGFLNKIPISAGTPQIVSFINIIYSLKPTIRDKFQALFFLFYKKRLETKYQREVENIFKLRKAKSGKLPSRARPVCTLLKELHRVPYDDVLNWFKTYNIDDKYLKTNFKGEKYRNMAEIEKKLKAILEDLREKRAKMQN